jgi:hypothetical protein
MEIVKNPAREDTAQRTPAKNAVSGGFLGTG